MVTVKVVNRGGGVLFEATFLERAPVLQHGKACALRATGSTQDQPPLNKICLFSLYLPLPPSAESTKISKTGSLLWPVADLLALASEKSEKRCGEPSHSGLKIPKWVSSRPNTKVTGMVIGMNLIIF